MAEKGRKTAMVVGLGAAAVGIILLATRGKAAPPLPLPELGTLYGRVTDVVTGGGIPGVLIVLDGIQVHTNGLGDYVIPNQIPGEYTAEFSKDNYTGGVIVVTLIAGETTELNIGLSPIVVPIAGNVASMLIWHEPLTSWESLGSDREVPFNKEIHLAPGWINDSEISIVGHMDLEITYPDGTSQILSATLNQDREVSPGAGKAGVAVQFEPFRSSQEGTYTIVATLSSGGQVLDSLTLTIVAVAIVSALAHLSGLVTDGNTGYPLEGVKVTLDGQIKYTDIEGMYAFFDLEPGDYPIKFEKEGYETLIM